MFGSATRSSVRYQLLLAAAPAPTDPNPGLVRLPDLHLEFSAYLQVASSASASEDLREMFKARVTVAHESTLSLDRDVTLEVENITLAFSDRVRTFAWLTEKLVSTSFAGAKAVLGMLQFLTPERDSLAFVAESDKEASTLLMSNSDSGTARLDASKSSKLYSAGSLKDWRDAYLAVCNLRCLLSVMTEDLGRPLLLEKMLEYSNLLQGRQGRLFFAAWRSKAYLAVHPFQDLQTILSAFLGVASNATLYGAVTRGERPSLANYQTPIDVADTLIRDLRAILNGNGLGKFEGVPYCAPWFGSVVPSSKLALPATASGAKPSASASSASGAAKRQKVLDPAELERKKGFGVLLFDPVVAGSPRLPTIDVYHKNKGAKTPERLCMKFLTKGHCCAKPDCKFPHISNVETLPQAEKDKLVTFVKNQAGLSWVEGKAPSGTNSCRFLQPLAFRF